MSRTSKRLVSDLALFADRATKEKTFVTALNSLYGELSKWRVMQKIGINPFKFGSDLARGEYFADREDEKQQLRADLKGGQRIVIYSARRYGKTALIVNVLDELVREGYLTAYLDISITPDKSLFISKYKSLFIKPGTVQWFIDWVKTNLPKIKISLGEAEFDLSGLANPDLDEVFERILDLPQYLARKRKARVIVAMDEFHEIRNFDSKHVENLMRSKFQFHDKVSYVFSGSKYHILHDMFETPGKPFYKSAKMSELGKIPEPLYAEFIVNMFRKTGIRIDRQLVDDVLTKTDAHTCYTQQLCHEIWDVCRARQRNVADRETLEIAIDQVFLNQSGIYEKIWSELPPGYRRVIIGIIRFGGHQIWSRDFRTKNRLTVGAIDKAIKHLTEQYLMEKDQNGDFVIPDLFMREWISRKMQ